LKVNGKMKTKGDIESMNLLSTEGGLDGIDGVVGKKRRQDVGSGTLFVHLNDDNDGDDDFMSGQQKHHIKIEIDAAVDTPSPPKEVVTEDSDSEEKTASTETKPPPKEDKLLDVDDDNEQEIKPSVPLILIDEKLTGDSVTDKQIAGVPGAQEEKKQAPELDVIVDEPIRQQISSGVDPNAPLDDHPKAKEKGDAGSDDKIPLGPEKKEEINSQRVLENVDSPKVTEPKPEDVLFNLLEEMEQLPSKKDEEKESKRRSSSNKESSKQKSHNEEDSNEGSEQTKNNEKEPEDLQAKPEEKVQEPEQKTTPVHEQKEPVHEEKVKTADKKTNNEDKSKQEHEPDMTGKPPIQEGDHKPKQQQPEVEQNSEPVEEQKEPEQKTTNPIEEQNEPNQELAKEKKVELENNNPEQSITPAEDKKEPAQIDKNDNKLEESNNNVENPEIIPDQRDKPDEHKPTEQLEINEPSDINS